MAVVYVPRGAHVRSLLLELTNIQHCSPWAGAEGVAAGGVGTFRSLKRGVGRADPRLSCVCSGGLTVPGEALGYLVLNRFKSSLWRSLTWQWSNV